MTSTVPLICFPHAGAGRMYYAGWRSAFSDAIDLQIVQYPLREQRHDQPMPATIGELASDICDELANVLSGPYAIWGHSMGSVISYEVTVLAQSRFDSAPLVFFSSGCSAPCTGSSIDAGVLDLPGGLERVLESYGGFTAEHLADRDIMSYLAPVVEADLRLTAEYRDTSYQRIDSAVVLLEGRDDAVTVEDWSRYTDRPVELLEFPGGHFFIDQHRPAIVDVMESRVQAAAEGRPSAATAAAQK